ncbi:DNA/RNA non-specific endonuclease [Psychrobacter cibarius]|uniref:DNA/RNA non-specific endonuclease n=1 Tax=Psychrobacter cibarius TaxID=282669 RepID=UPI001D104985|nr:DNA/RNA non-specific endonuclease [Psychrobacter cibarius]
MISFGRLNARLKNSITMTVMAVVVSITSAHADDFTQCSESFYGGVYPEFINTKLSNKTQALCMDGFAVMYSGVSRTPLWSAEYLDRKRLQQAKEIDREDSFHEESRLPKSARASLSDYSGSGHDRGHLAPNADMANRSQQYDSFSLANIAPQSPRNNRYIWRNIESATRYLTQQYGEVYSITGVAFTGKTTKQLADRVLVPSHFFKAVYIPAINQAGVYYAPNDESERIEVISVDELSTRIGIDVLPVLDAKTKTQAFDLPLKAGESSELPDEPTEEPAWMLFVWAILEWVIVQLQA